MRKIDRELFNSVKQGNFHRVQRCLNEGANINVEDNYGKTSLDLARERKYMEIVDILSSAKEMKEFYTPLHNAVRDGDLEAVKYFVSKDNDVVNSCSYGYTLLHVAAIYGHLKIIQFLLMKGQIFMLKILFLVKSLYTVLLQVSVRIL